MTWYSLKSGKAITLGPWLSALIPNSDCKPDLNMNKLMHLNDT